MEKLRVGTAAAAPGTRSDGVISVSKRPGGQDLSIPVIVVNGAGDGPVLWIDGAIHGDEPEGPLAIHKLLVAVNPRLLRGAIVAVPVLNVSAFEAQQRGNPFDSFTYDMNRIYPGKSNGYPSERVCWAHYRAMIEMADMLIAIHSGGAHSYLAQAQFFNGTPQALEMAKAMGPGWDLVLKSLSASGSPPASMAEKGKPAITVEMGGICSTMPNDFHRNTNILRDGIMNVMRHFNMLDGDPIFANEWQIGVQRAVLANIGGFFVPDPQVKYRTPMNAGSVMATINDLYGKILEEVKAPCDGQIFGLRTQPCVYQGDWACFFAEIQETIR